MRTVTNKQLQDRSEYAGWADGMARALALAGEVIAVHPNPRVGCVLVNNSKIIGEGRHLAAGEPHAEVEALQSAEKAGQSVRGCTAFVTLEPCCHKGKTGACTDALIAAGIKQVVIAGEDPNPAVAGAGIRGLEQAGLAVFKLEGFTAKAESLNKGFMKRYRQGLPFVRCKLAMSIDGRTALANGHSKWLTGSAARGDVQGLRAASSAIITGIGTVLADNPSLTLRADELNLPPAAKASNHLALKRQPLRVILDSQLRTPPKAKILQANPSAIIYCQQDAATENLSASKTTIRPLPPSARGSCKKQVKLPLRSVLESLAQQDQCNEVLIEAGPTLSGAFISAGLVDELIIYIAPKLLGEDAMPLMHLPPLSRLANAKQLRFVSCTSVGYDIKLIAIPG